MKAITVAGALMLPSAGICAQPVLGVVDTGFELKLEDGTVLKGRELEGATLHLALDGAQTVAVKVASIVPDPEDPEILRHEFKVHAAGAWQSFCSPNAQGETWGFPIALPAGHPGRDGEITLTCSSGAVGKCVRFGYKPWKKGPHGENLGAYHAACVHMVRADYCGNGTAHTRDGTVVDIYDAIGIQKPETTKDAGSAFEAGYAASGAVCVARASVGRSSSTARGWRRASATDAPPVQSVS